MPTPRVASGCSNYGTGFADLEAHVAGIRSAGQTADRRSRVEWTDIQVYEAEPDYSAVGSTTSKPMATVPP